MALRLRDINAGYNGRIQLRDVSIDIDDRDFVGIVGPNGGGKTTLLRVILGLLTPYSGTIEYLRNGERADSLSVGYLPQTRDIDTDFPISVGDIVASGMNSPRRLFGGYTREQRRMAEETMRTIGIADMQHRPVKALSGGELQRVLLALALDPMPDLLLLDEPVSGVDQNGLELFYEIVADLREKEDMAIILISHDLNMVAKHADQVVLLNKGVICSGTPDEVFADARTREIFGLLAGETAREAAADIPRAHGREGGDA